MLQLNIHAVSIISSVFHLRFKKDCCIVRLGSSRINCLE